MSRQLRDCVMVLNARHPYWGGTVTLKPASPEQAAFAQARATEAEAAATATALAHAAAAARQEVEAASAARAAKAAKEEGEASEEDEAESTSAKIEAKVEEAKGDRMIDGEEEEQRHEEGNAAVAVQGPSGDEGWVEVKSRRRTVKVNAEATVVPSPVDHETSGAGSESLVFGTCEQQPTSTVGEWTFDGSTLRIHWPSRPQVCLSFFFCLSSL